MKNKITVVVVTFNRKVLLLEAINRILLQKDYIEKVIIIDNASSDGTEQFLYANKIIGIDIVKYIKLDENIGGSGGFYTGIKYALKENAEWICLSDDDAIYDSEFFSVMNKNIELNKNVKAFTGTVMTESQIDILHRRRIVNNITLEQTSVPIEEYTNSQFKEDVFSFVGCLIKKDVIESIGLPEKDYFIWFDDTEYSLRVRKMTEVLNINSAIINHKTNISLDKSKYNPNWKEFYGFRNNYFVILKYSKYKIFGIMFINYYCFKQIVKSVLQGKYKNNRIHRIKVVIDSFLAFIFKKKGKDNRYLPN